jgi:hypothetical protein
MPLQRNLDLNEVRATVRKHKGRMVAMKHLPLVYQMTAAQYMSLAGEADAWDRPPVLEAWLEKNWPIITSDREKGQKSVLKHQRLFAVEFPKHMPFYLERYGDTMFGVVEIPIAEMIALIMKGGDMVECYNGNWDEYHAWYLNQGYIPDYDVSKPLWPVWIDINGSGDELLEDGWHRFNDYVRKGVQVIPAIYFPER